MTADLKRIVFIIAVCILQDFNFEPIRHSRSQKQVFHSVRPYKSYNMNGVLHFDVAMYDSRKECRRMPGINAMENIKV